MRILFAEDDRDLSRAVKALLEHSGYSVDLVDNGTDALDYALSGAYDGRILDWMMAPEHMVQGSKVTYISMSSSLQSPSFLQALSIAITSA